MEPNDAGNPTGASGRPLGRGLEDISYLFLSPRAGDGRTRPALPVRPSEPASSPPVVQLRPASVTRERLATMVLESLVALEDGLQVVDAKIPCQPCGEIDLLAVDRTGKLAIVDFETAIVNDGLLIRGLGHFDWILRHLPNVQRMYPSAGVDFSLPPRLVLLAPQFSPLLRRVVRQITRPHLDCVRSHTVETPHGPGILFEPVVGD